MPKSQLSFTFRPPVDVMEALSERAKATSHGRSALVIEALRRFLDQPEPDGTIKATDLKRIADRLEAIELEVRVQAARLLRVEVGHDEAREPAIGQHRQEIVMAGGNRRGHKRHADKGSSQPPAPQVASVAEAITVLRLALESMRHNNAGPGLRGIQQVLPFVELMEDLPHGARAQLLRHLKPEEAFDRTKGGRVRAAIKETLDVLKWLEKESI